MYSKSFLKKASTEYILDLHKEASVDYPSVQHAAFIYALTHAFPDSLAKMFLLLDGGPPPRWMLEDRVIFSDQAIIKF